MPGTKKSREMCCHCFGVSFDAVRGTIEREQCRTVREVTRGCRAGGGCRSCWPEIQVELDEFARKTAGNFWRRLWRRLFVRGSA